jgi:hypothetical protein
MKKLWIPGAVLLVGALGWLTLCALSCNDPFISRPLWQRIQRGPGTTVDLATVAPFAWDRVFIFGPYTSSREVDKRLGFHWDEYWQTGIEASKGYNLVVFVRGQRVVRWFEHARNRGELEELAQENGFARADAKFQVQVGGDGRLALRK